MQGFDFMQQALLNLTASKLRSFLAVLGILVGTAAIVALINCGQLATEKALAEFKSLGTDLLAITVFANDHNHSENTPELTLDFWQSLPQQEPAIIRIAPYAMAYQTVSFQGKVLQAPLIAANEQLAAIINIQLSQGSFVSHFYHYEHVCVIGSGIAAQIRTITQDNPIGKWLRVGNTLYTIIGIAAPWRENSFFNEDINRSIVIPVAGAQLISKDTKVNNAIIVLKPDAAIDTVVEHLKQLINLQSPKLGMFTRSAKQIIASMESQGQVFTLLLAVIGSISLLVGGIGVMNIMLVSVSERKKEIGIRKAIGAKNREIQTLFLIESILLSLSGGFLGVILGLLFTAIVAYFSDWPFHIYSLPPIAGFSVSVLTGIFFGFYPAKRAAKLEPIVCLRQD